MRYIRFTSEGDLVTRYDSEIHTVIPPEAIQISDGLFFRTLNESDGVWKLIGGVVTKVSFPPPTPQEAFAAIVKSFDNAIEAHLHAGAVAKGYTNIERACMYASYPNPFWGESKSFVQWVGEVWAYCYVELQKVQEGTRTMPTVEQIISELPAWRPLNG